MNSQTGFVRRNESFLKAVAVFLGSLEVSLLLFVFGGKLGQEIGLVFVVPATAAGFLFHKRLAYIVTIFLMLDDFILLRSYGFSSIAFQTLVFPLATFVASLVRQGSSEDFEGNIVPKQVKLEEENNLLITSLNSLNVGFIIVDPEYKILSLNSAAKRFINLQGKTVVKGAVLDPLAFGATYEIDEISKEFGEKFDFKGNLVTAFKQRKIVDAKDIEFRNQILHIFMSPVVMFRDGNIDVIGSVIMMEDTTNEKMLERTRNEFFSIASHELRTPLTSIRGNTSLIKQFYGEKLEKDPQLKEMVDDIHDSSVRLIEIVNDFLDTSRLEQGRLIFKPVNFEFQTLTEEVEKDLSSLAKEKKLYLKTDLAKTPPVFADRDRVKQVLINLVGNSLKFTENGGVEVSSLSDGNFLKISVKDTGRGIAEENKNLLFRKFQQANSNILTRDATKGTGLGLYISKLMIEGMGGKIFLESSEAGKGTTFVFTLPFAKEEK